LFAAVPRGMIQPVERSRHQDMGKITSGQRVARGDTRGTALLARSALVAIVAALLMDQSRASDEPQVPEAFEPCIACHSYQKDEPLQEAPPLWGVVGRRVASVEGFDYSPALRSLAGAWDRARLDQFLTNPKAMVPGTQMKLGGIPDPTERAIVLDFLETLSPARPR
jgi:cytochrome c